MALGDINLFSWKSKEQQKQEMETYEKWAFPFGQAQRDKLVKLMLELFPKESEPTVLIPFLTCKELYCKLAKTPDQADYAINKLLTDIKKYKRIIRKRDMPTYVALVSADQKVDENLEYPTAQQIRDMVASFPDVKG
ncbi:MAG: hypothetical protein GXY20_06010 [Clostridiales bacterium]|nr:hypothetical protein [Clostridiales bacterium]